MSSKRYRQEQANSYERKFKIFCSKNKIGFVQLDKDKGAQEKFLGDPRGKSPDFLCQKNNKSIFVEVKTHTLLTNEARSREMNRVVQDKKAAGLSGTNLFAPFDPIPELNPFEGYLRNASKKFKNIKKEYNFPRILLIDGSFIWRSDVHVLFSSVQSYRKDGTLSKTHRGIFDSTGSNVSSLVYWSTDLKRCEGIANHRAKIPLSEEYFRIFFEALHG